MVRRDFTRAAWLQPFLPYSCLGLCLCSHNMWCEQHSATAPVQYVRTNGVTVLGGRAEGDPLPPAGQRVARPAGLPLDLLDLRDAADHAHGGPHLAPLDACLHSGCHSGVSDLAHCWGQRGPSHYGPAGCSRCAS